VADAVSKDKTYKVKIDIDSHMQKAISALKKAQETFSDQAAEMKELGESEMSEGYAKRAKAVEDFLKGIGN
jgi:DNA-binding transcriptional regulator WhiA